MKTITLVSGLWLPVCSCGALGLPIRLKRTIYKMVPYCWHCEKFNVKFEKMEEIGDLAFSHNWNGKLNCECFTTIRLANRTKFYPGARKRILLKGQPKGMATVLHVKPFLLEELNEITARIDTGLSQKECTEVIRTMYKNKAVNWKMQPLALILLQYDKNRNEPKFDM